MFECVFFHPLDHSPSRMCTVTETGSALEGRQEYLPLSVGSTEATSSVEAERDVGCTPPRPRPPPPGGPPCVGGDVSTVTPPRADV